MIVTSRDIPMRKILLFIAALPFLANAANEPIVTEATTTSTVDTTINSPPPSAIIPTMNFSNSDLCTVGVAGAVQTQILGLSAGSTVRDLNCERLKNAKTLFDMGMKVAAVSTMCQDKRVFDAMMNAGTPCPYDGLIGPDAKEAWLANEEKQPNALQESKALQTAAGVSGVVGVLALLLLL